MFVQWLATQGAGTVGGHSGCVALKDQLEAEAKQCLRRRAYVLYTTEILSATVSSQPRGKRTEKSQGCVRVDHRHW